MKPSSLRRSSFILLFFLLHFVQAHQINTFTLRNGINITLIKDDTVPFVYHKVIYKVGSVDEPKNLYGIAHLLEHIMFRGSKFFSKEDLYSIVTRSGGSFNASTSKDYTEYHAIVQEDELKNLIMFEADRMSNLLMDKRVVNLERKIVKEERLMRIETQNSALFYEELDQMFFGPNGYSSSTAGYIKSLDAIKVSDLRDFYSKWYIPANSYVIIAGNFDMQKVARMVKRYYGQKKYIDKNKNKVSKSIINVNESRVSKSVVYFKNAKVNQPIYVRQYFIDGVGVAKDLEKFYKDNLLLDIMSSRIFPMRDYFINTSKKAVYFYVGADLSARGKTSLYFVIIPRPGVKLSKIDKLLEQQINLFVKQGVSQQVLLDSARSERDMFLIMKDNIVSYVNYISYFIANGIDFGKFEERVKDFSSVTDKEINQRIKELFFNRPYQIGYLYSNNGEF